MSLGARRFGACRVTGAHGGQPIAEIVDWVGEGMPSTDDIRRAKRSVLVKDAADLEKGPLRYVVFRKAVVVAAALAAKADPKKAIRRDDERDAREKAKRAGLDLKTWRLREDAREVASMWRADEYDDVYDVVSDLVALVPKVARALPKEAAALERVRRAVTRDVESLGRDPELARAAKSWAKALAALARPKP